MLRAAVDPVTVSVTIDRPREEVFAYLADIANHPEFTDHYLKDWRLTRVDSWAAAPAPASASTRRCTASAGRHDVRRGRAAAPDRRGRPRRQVQPHQDDRDWTLEPGPAAGPTSSTCSSPSRALPTDRLVEALSAPPRLVQAQGPQGAAAPAVDPRGGRGPRRARDGRRALDFRRPMTPRLARSSLVAAARRARRRRLRQQARRSTDDGRDRGPRTSTVDGLKYQMQMSRYLNPATIEDASYLAACPRASDTPAADETLVRRLDARRERDRRAARAGQQVRDRGHAGERLRADRDRPDDNPFVYEPRRGAAGDGAAAASTPPPARARSRARCCSSSSRPTSLQNRPLELRIVEPERRRADGTLDLDV